MNKNEIDGPFVALIDDDEYSAHLLMRMLLAHGSPAVQWFGDAAEGLARLNAVLADVTSEWPGLLIVDLKAHSAANLDFVTALHPLARQKGIPVAVMAQTDDRALRQALLDAGAAAVFVRHAELGAYRREAASLVSFWARNQRLNAVGM